MAENAFLVNLVQILGVSVLMFIVWYLYHKSTVKTFKEIMDSQEKQSERNHKVLTDMIQTNMGTIAILTRIEQKIDDNIWCPLVREKIRKMKGDNTDK